MPRGGEKNRSRSDLLQNCNDRVKAGLKCRQQLPFVRDGRRHLSQNNSLSQRSSLRSLNSNRGLHQEASCIDKVEEFEETRNAVLWFSGVSDC